MKLIIKKFDTLVKEISLKEGQEYIIGRQENCDIILSSETLISRKHLKIRQSENQLWMIECLSDLGGLYMNGESVDGVEMDTSATLSFHEYTFQFVPPEIEEEKNAEKQEPLTPQPKEEKTEVSLEGATKILSPIPLSYSLSVSINGLSPQYIDLNEGMSWIAGREEECDIILEHKYLTKRHFEIIREIGQFTIKDLGSSNGTFLNGKKLQPQKSYELKSQDVISIGDMEIIFEARNKDFHKFSENLPTISKEEQTPPPSMALPKVLLEDSEAEETSEEDTVFNKASPKKKFNRKRLVLYGFISAALIGLLLFGETEKEGKSKTAKKANSGENKKERIIEATYQFASVLMSQQKYALCVEELNNLHKLTPYYKDSQQLLIQCQTAVDNQRRADEIKEQEEAAKKAKEKVNKVVAECEKKLEQFESVEELNVCLDEAFNLDPSHPKISEMQNFLEHKAEMKRMEQERKQTFQKSLQRKLAMYRKAKKLREKGKTLQAVPAYEKFLKVAKNQNSLKSTYKKALQELKDMKRTYEETLNRLHTNCETHIKSSQMKTAYYECLKILDFKKEDEKAPKWINQAKNSLKSKFKPLYVKSALEESLSNVEEAKELWEKILKEDVETGYYYKKAKLKLDKYK